MALDPYSPCPAGTGKKLKFCCSDLIGELEKIQRMLEGDQRLACLEHIESLQSRFPGRACLLTSQALIQLGLGRTEDARRAIESVLAQAPVNPVALAEAALITLGEGDVPQAIETLQRSIAASPSPMPATVVDVIASVAEGLISFGHVPAAMGHLLLLASILPQDEHTLALIVRLNASPQVPLLYKEEPDFSPAPEGASWGPKFDEALEPVRRGAWRVAADKLAALADTTPDAAAIWHNLAVLRSWLADDQGAVEALRRLSALDVAQDERVEAEALAQLLDPDTIGARVDLLKIEYPIQNSEELTAKLTDRRVATSAVDPGAWTERNEVPPHASYVLLDRAAPRNGEGLTRQAVPNVLGHLLVFGRQTDREARLQMTFARPNLQAARAALADLCGPQLGAPGAEEKSGDIPATQWALSWNWRLPEDMAADQVHKLLVEQRRYSILEQWTKTPLTVLEGRTPEEAAADERLRIRLLAAILVLELSFQEASAAPVFDELRGRLGLPLPATIDPAAASLDQLPLARLHRVDWQKVDDGDLLSANRRAMFAAAHLALRQTAQAILGRDSLKEKVSPAQVYGLLARLEDDTRQAISYLDQARTSAEAAGQSTARFDLDELSLRLERGEPNEFGRVLSHIQSSHAREPGVAQALLQILVEAGLVTPDGRAVGRPPDEGAPLVVPGEAAETGKIWTPDSDAGPGKKSALWVPGGE